MTDEDDVSEKLYAEEVRTFETFVRPRLERAEEAYGQALKSLWLGNAGATLSVLAFIGAAWRQGGTFPHQLIWPLWLFVLGLLSMGVGSLVSLVREGRDLRRMQKARSWTDLRGGDVPSPVERVGLTFGSWRTRAAVASGLFFFLGCIVGLIELTCG